MACKIDSLTETEHTEILRMLKEMGVTYSSNRNGVFFNAASLTESQLKTIADFVDYCVGNQDMLGEYEAALSVTAVASAKCLQRPPPPAAPSSSSSPLELPEAEAAAAGGASPPPASSATPAAPSPPPPPQVVSDTARFSQAKKRLSKPQQAATAQWMMFVKDQLGHDA